MGEACVYGMSVSFAVAAFDPREFLGETLGGVVRFYNIDLAFGLTEIEYDQYISPVEDAPHFRREQDTELGKAVGELLCEFGRHGKELPPLFRGRRVCSETDSSEARCLRFWN